MKYKLIEIEMTGEELKTTRTVGQNLVDLLIRATEPVGGYEDEETEEMESGSEVKNE